MRPTVRRGTVRQILFHFSPEIVGQVYGPGNGSHLIMHLETNPVLVKHGVANLTLFYQGINKEKEGGGAGRGGEGRGLGARGGDGGRGAGRGARGGAHHAQ